MTNELKPCPFCGGEAHILIRNNEHFASVKYYVLCRKCGTRSGRHDTTELVKKAWNRREEDGK